MSEAQTEGRSHDVHPEGPVGASAGPFRTLRVQAVFRGVAEQHLQMLAGEMIARAHELANQPECACDVDVSIQYAAPVVPIHEC